MVVVERVCPRCGSKYNWIERHKRGGRIYLYAVHKEGKGKNAKRWKCYLGPSNSYVYVTKTHRQEGLRLKGLADVDRALEYLDALINYVETVELDGAVRLKLAERFKQLAEVLSREPGAEEEQP